MTTKHSVKAKVAKAHVMHTEVPQLFTAIPQTFHQKPMPKDAYSQGFPVAVLPFATAKQARAAVKVHNMTPIQRQTWFKQKMFDQFGWLFNDEEARAVLSALHFREGTKE